MTTDSRQADPGPDETDEEWEARMDKEVTDCVKALIAANSDLVAAKGAYAVASRKFIEVVGPEGCPIVMGDQVILMDQAGKKVLVMDATIMKG